MEYNNVIYVACLCLFVYTTWSCTPTFNFFKLKYYLEIQKPSHTACFGDGVFQKQRSKISAVFIIDGIFSSNEKRFCLIRCC